VLYLFIYLSVGVLYLSIYLSVEVLYLSIYLSVGVLYLSARSKGESRHKATRMPAFMKGLQS